MPLEDLEDDVHVRSAVVDMFLERGVGFPEPGVGFQERLVGALPGGHHVADRTSDEVPRQAGDRDRQRRIGSATWKNTELESGRTHCRGTLSCSRSPGGLARRLERRGLE